MNRQDYIAMLAGRGLKIGDQVLCDYRLPYCVQWWTAPAWVGVIQDVSDDPATWNGSNSEAHYCCLLKYVSVRYLDAGHLLGHQQHDSLGHLRELHRFPGELPVTCSPWFVSEKSGLRDLYEFAAHAGLGHLYESELRDQRRTRKDFAA